MNVLDRLELRVKGKLAVALKIIDVYFPLNHKAFTVTRCPGSDTKYHCVRKSDSAWMICEYAKGGIVWICGIDTFLI